MLGKYFTIELHLYPCHWHRISPCCSGWSWICEANWFSDLCLSLGYRYVPSGLALKLPLYFKKNRNNNCFIYRKIHNNNKSTNSFFWFHQHEPVADNILVCTSPTSITKVILIQCATCQFYLVNSSLSYSIWTGCCMWRQIENVCVFVCSGNGFLLCHPRVTPWCAKLVWAGMAGQGEGGGSRDQTQVSYMPNLLSGTCSTVG